MTSVFSTMLFSHNLRENYLRLDYNETTKNMKVDFDIETRLLESDFIDDNHNGIISYKELYAHKSTLFDYFKNHTILKYNNKELSFENSKIRFHRYQSQTYMNIEKLFKFINLNNLTLNYSMFFELENNHKLLIHLKKKKDAVLDINHQQYQFVDTTMTQFQRFKIFIKEGIFHILDGTDHLLFILMLLIPSVIINIDKKDGIKRSLISLVKIITTFSVAHSLTLFISGMGWYIPNSTIVESGIAFSIFVVALLNFLHKYTDVSYLIVFLFGLIHGFGFANVLEIAQVKDTFSFVVALLGFNSGVEIGQIAVILVVLPVLFLISKWKYYTVVFQSLTFFTMVVSFIWFFQRVGLL